MKVLFLANQELPDQSANATRIINLAKLFRKCGVEPILIGTRYNADTLLRGKYDGIKYMHVDAQNYLSLPKNKRQKYLERLFLEAMDIAWTQDHFCIIVASSFSFQSIQFILNYAKSKRIAVIYNSVEWFQKDNESFYGLSGKIKFIYNRLGLLVQHVKVGNIIGISSLLENYYKKRKCNTIRIPTIVDKEKYVYVEQNHNKKIVIAYAGSPAKKDYISNAIKALLLLNSEELQSLEFHLYGIDVKQLKNLGITEETIHILQDILFVHGRIPYSQVQEKISSADFTILLRPNLRYANAGFPTKVGESMMCGTPVIANHTSDLNLYIRDGDTGIVVDDESAEACAEGYRKALRMSVEEKNKMRSNARKEAEHAFYYLSYKKEMTEFIRSLKKQ